MKTLILIRHGETDYTSQNRYCGQRDIPLNKKGMRQARRLRLRLKGLKVDRVYSSDLKRALQTAKIIFGKNRIFTRKALREIDFGRFCGLTFKEIYRLYPDILKIWLRDPTKIKIPSGEDMQGFAKRVIGCFKDIASKNRKETVAIVSHGGPIRVILLNLLRLGLGRFWEIEQDVAAVNIVEFKNGRAKIKIDKRRWANLSL